MTDQITSRVIGNLGHITLNRPKALNALTLDMCVEITRLMTLWEKDANIGAVLIDGAGERAFCAGGDVILLHDSGKAGDDRGETFWRVEYALNELIHRYSKPYITLIDGFVMGGGVGLSVHGAHRVAGDHTLFAMPETGIGYFPDVGGTYFLPRLSYKDFDMAVGNWLGMTGARLGARECYTLGIANHYVPTDQHAAFVDAMGKAALDGSDDKVLDVVEKFIKAPPAHAPLPAALGAFGATSPADIEAALMSDGSDWAQKQLSIMKKKSPLAVAVTFEALKRGKGMSFRDVMTQELDISLNFMKTQDFYEGIRAQLIDKDRNPKWSHQDVSDVSADQVARLFRKTATPRQKFLD